MSICKHVSYEVTQYNGPRASLIIPVNVECPICGEHKNLVCGIGDVLTINGNKRVIRYEEQEVKVVVN